MMTIILLAILTLMLWIGFKLTGAILMAFVWLFIELPLAIMIGTLGILCCCTIILIPLGMVLIKAGTRLLIPG